MSMLNSPVLFLIFNRPDTTRKVFEAIRRAKPRQLFVAADGPRTGRDGEAEKCRETREVIQDVDWECEVKTLFRDRNHGCREAVSSAITWFFEHVESGIILEDDCLPSDSFFGFCGALLDKYAEDERVMMISGDNFQDGIKRGDASYFFSQIPHIWGWATWRRAWNLYNLEMESFPKFIEDDGIERISRDVDIQNFWLSNFIGAYEGRINTWDYQWMYAMFAARGLSICPQVNLISNIGFGENSTHTADKGSRFADMKRGEIRNNLHPELVRIDQDADMYAYRVVCDVWRQSKLKGLARQIKLIRHRRKCKRQVNAFKARNAILEKKSI